MRTGEGDRDPLTARATFELVGDETRAEILRVLSDARAGGLPPALSFSELRRRIRTETRSSQFNYHLDQLTGTFLEDRSEGSAQLVDAFVDADEGYALRPAGTLLTRVVTAMGAPESGPDATRVAPFDADASCHYCGTTLRAGYRNRTFHLQCPACDHLYAYTLVPPGLVGGDPDERAVLDRAATYLRRKYLAFARGTCPLCANGVPPDVVSPETIDWPRADRLEALVRRVCGHCGHTNYAHVGTELLRDGGLVAFCRSHGRRVRERPLWDLSFAVTDRHTTVVSTDPWEAVLAVPAGDAELRLRVDEELTVLERTRATRRDR
jgi:DNA-binding transcriptional ArsR family regulator